MSGEELFLQHDFCSFSWSIY